MIITTLCLVKKGNKILLGMKKRGFGQGRWNGFGGKVSQGERIEDAAKRETKEESGIDVLEAEKIGVIDFAWRNKPEIMQVHIFSCDKFSGQEKETEEMRPEWVEIKNLDYEKMWADDIYWYPLFLSGKKFKGNFLFDDKDKVLEYKIEEVKEI